MVCNPCHLVTSYGVSNAALVCALASSLLSSWLYMYGKLRGQCRACPFFCGKHSIGCYTGIHPGEAVSAAWWTIVFKRRRAGLLVHALLVYGPQYSVVKEPSMMTVQCPQRHFSTAFYFHQVTINTTQVAATHAGLLICT